MSVTGKYGGPLPKGPWAERLHEIFDRLLAAFGPQHWWPGETPFEVCVGAILTQNTNWANVSRAIKNLKEAGLLNPEALFSIPRHVLAEIIRPAGYYNVKSERILTFVAFLMQEFSGDLDAAFSLGLWDLRSRLLSLKGIGPETADSILLYAGGYPIFVVDAYTARILERHGLVGDDVSYDSIQSLFMDNLPSDPALFNEFHALLVALGKGHCRKGRPRCETCPLAGIYLSM